MNTYKIAREQAHIVPTHIAKIKECDYNDNPANITFAVIGSEMPCILAPNGIGYLVLCTDGIYRYMSLNGEIEIVGTFTNQKVLDIIKEGE